MPLRPYSEPYGLALVRHKSCALTLFTTPIPEAGTKTVCCCYAGLGYSFVPWLFSGTSSAQCHRAVLDLWEKGIPVHHAIPLTPSGYRGSEGITEHSIYVSSLWLGLLWIMALHWVVQVRQKAWLVKQVRQQVRQSQERPRGWHHDDANPLFCMAFPTGVEPVACPLGGDRSILLSYGNLVAGIIQEALCF